MDERILAADLYLYCLDDTGSIRPKELIQGCAVI